MFDDGSFSFDCVYREKRARVAMLVEVLSSTVLKRERENGIDGVDMVEDAIVLLGLFGRPESLSTDDSNIYLFQTRTMLRSTINKRHAEIVR